MYVSSNSLIGVEIEEPGGLDLLRDVDDDRCGLLERACEVQARVEGLDRPPDDFLGPQGLEPLVDLEVDRLAIDPRRRLDRAAPCAGRTASAAAASSVEGLDRALALAALDLVRLLALPVDEVHQVLDVEGHRHRQVLDELLEALHRPAVDERVEDLAFVALVLVELGPARPSARAWRVVGLEPLAVGDLAALVASADVGDVRRDLAIADLERSAVGARCWRCGAGCIRWGSRSS